MFQVRMTSTDRNTNWPGSATGINRGRNSVNVRTAVHLISECSYSGDVVIKKRARFLNQSTMICLTMNTTVRNGLLNYIPAMGTTL